MAYELLMLCEDCQFASWGQFSFNTKGFVVFDPAVFADRFLVYNGILIMKQHYLFFTSGFLRNKHQLLAYLKLKNVCG